MNNDDILITIIVGLIVTSVAVGCKFGASTGWATLGIGLIILGLSAAYFKYMG